VASPKQQRIDPKRVPQPSAATPGSKPPVKPAVKPPVAKSSKSGRSGKPGGRPPGAPKVKKAGPREWIGGARLRTLPLSVAPVILGTAAAHEELAAWNWVRPVLALIVAVAIQIGVNYANDYSDGVRGTDNFRVGPARLTGSGAAKPRTVRAVAFAFFGIGALAGVILVVLTQQWWLLAVGAACIIAAYFYTGGKRPYGYAGLGELFVFVFFGLVATLGTTYVQIGHINVSSLLGGIAIGFIACAVLMVNNIRDLDQDRVAGKRTLAVRLGQRASRISFVVLILLPFAILGYFCLIYDNAFLTYFVLLLALPASLITITAKAPKELILALQLASFTALLYALGLGWSIAF
jgi:1,4-dihydroxy-2-naphthoate octaprenyltransferase